MNKPRKTKSVTIKVDPELWHMVTMTCLDQSITKRTVLDDALKVYLYFAGIYDTSTYTGFCNPIPLFVFNQCPRPDFSVHTKVQNTQKPATKGYDPDAFAALVQEEPDQRND